MLTDMVPFEAATVLRLTTRQINEFLWRSAAACSDTRTAWKHRYSCREMNAIHILYKLHLCLSLIGHDAADLVPSLFSLRRII